MAIRIKLFQKKDTNKNIDGKWYGRVVKRDEVHTKELARSISHNTTLTEADVQAAIIALVEEMKLRLQGGDTVVLDGFGRFRLSVHSEMVSNRDDYNLKKHVTRIFCKFVPAATRNPFDRHLERPFVDGTELQRV